MGITTRITSPRADLEVQVMQQNHCDGVLSNDWNTLLGQQISRHTAMSTVSYTHLTLPTNREV